MHEVMGADHRHEAMDLAPAGAPYVLVEDRLDGAGHARLFRDPVAIVRCDDPRNVDAALARIEAALAEGRHAAGFLAYELGAALEPRLTPLLRLERDTPLLWFGLFREVLAVEGAVADAWLADRGPPPPLSGLAPGHDRPTHVAKVREVLARIAAGDIYQANLTFPIRFGYRGDPLALYAALRAEQPVAHGGLVWTGEASVISVSPELFVRIADDRIATRPMKGTAPRGDDPADDARRLTELVADPKQRAENLMIVDLLRNDLARIGEPGSVAVPALFTPETYPSLHTLTSTVTARLRPGTSLRERIAALFPCGSVVGAPKIRAAEILAEIEDAPRGVYTGSIGTIAPGGDLHFNVAIRTAVVTASGEGRYGVGGGIVADSDPDAEYDEALLKARILTGLAEPYALIETFRWSAARGFVRLEAHLARLAASSARLGFALDRARVERHLTDAARQWGAEDMRVRLTLARDGTPDVTAAPVAPPPARARLAFAGRPVDAADPFLRHKTTHRAAHEAAFAEAQRSGCDEAILLNRHGRVADGSRNTLFVEIDGRMITPPVTDGALPGILRAELIEADAATVAGIPRDTLMEARRLWIGNSLHGLREAEILPLP
ncbi:aminodeoxychorismate synthase component I [Sphingomonas sp.]|uniref:aminodeoxychorismate synthase component I n=1 Tax=Sphingomonas sp. TaxID=28214 RepID=UPI002BE54606|nr:aminodeoxychorismate synthase component I [Sphingomonas sp.]HWK35704.1 aminodeoxychorismate synthase component I [Sphingomonas sp.]